MATHSSTLAWKTPWMEPGGLQSMGSQSQTQLSNFTFTFHFHALEKEMATHSSVLPWRIPGMGEPGGLPSTGSHRVRHDWRDLAEAAATLILVWLRWVWFSQNFPVEIYEFWCVKMFPFLCLSKTSDNSQGQHFKEYHWEPPSLHSFKELRSLTPFKDETALNCKVLSNSVPYPQRSKAKYF